MNHSIAENFMRSAKAPAISAGVMIAKVIWKHMYTVSGIVTARLFGLPMPVEMSLKMPCKKTRLSPPIKGEPGVNARL